MGKGRLEAFSDGVLAVVITIMVLELKVPHGTELSALVPLVPVFLSYVLSFVMVGIYWNNHHHVWQTARSVNGAVLLANMHLLFWLSLFPFVTGWMGENHFASVPAALFGVVALMSAVAYTILVRSLIGLHGKESPLAKAIGGDSKGWISLGLYAVAIPAAFFDGVVAFGIYVLVAVIWFIPDTRIERTIAKS
ncbi:MAG: TMEM175 family protein [Micropepsaceae bacterium]